MLVALESFCRPLSPPLTLSRSHIEEAGWWLRHTSPPRHACRELVSGLETWVLKDARRQAQNVSPRLHRVELVFKLNVLIILVLILSKYSHIVGSGLMDPVHGT